MKNVFIFVLGAAVGATATYFGTRKLFQKMADDEIADMEAYYKDKYKDFSDIEEREEALNKREEEVATMAIQKDYIPKVESPRTNYSGTPEDQMPQKDQPDDHLKFIPGEDYGMLNDDNWRITTMTYYEDDDIMVDMQRNIYRGNEIAEYIGTDFKNHWGEFDENEPDACYIRNFNKKLDIELLQDTHYSRLDE